MYLGANWVDLVILIVLAYFVFEAFRVGLWVVLADFLSFLLSLLIALRGYQIAAMLLRTQFSLSPSVSNALGFLFTAIVSEAILGILFIRATTLIPKKILDAEWTKPLAIIPALGEGFILVAFILTLVLGLPVKPTLKQDVSESRIGEAIITQTSGIEKRLADVFGGVIEDSLTYFTVKPESSETVQLNIKAHDLKPDDQAELEMFALVNQERRNAGVPELVWAPGIVPVSRSHATDMWERSYFGHVSPDGEDVGDRLQKQKINYTLAGENLALAPTTATAHTGLMNSEEHRANIFEPGFKRVGIGVIDNGYYGKMFVQVFSD